MLKQLLEIFKPGKWTDLHGRQLEFSEADVRQVAEVYDPALYAAPLVIGHPKLEDPSYGEASALSFDGVLKADTENVDPQFADLVNKKRYSKISVSLFQPDATNNPTPGNWYLRHIGFLGAVPPAVPGLKPASFAGDADDISTFEFAADGNRWAIGTVLRNLREFLIEKFGAEAADQVVPKWAAEEAEEATRQPTETSTPTDYAAPEEPLVEKKTEQQQNADFAQRTQQLDTRESDVAAREAKLAQAEAKQRQDAIAEFADGLIEEGKLLPAEKPGLVALMASLDGSEPLSFADGDGLVEKPALQFMKDFLQGLPERVDFAERGANTDTDDAAATSFAAPAGYTVDPDRLALHNKALAYQQKNNCDYVAAVTAVSR